MAKGQRGESSKANRIDGLGAPFLLLHVILDEPQWGIGGLKKGSRLMIRFLVMAGTAGEDWPEAWMDVAELTDVIGGVSEKEEHETVCRPHRIKSAASEQSDAVSQVQLQGVGTSSLCGMPVTLRKSGQRLLPPE